MAEEKKYSGKAMAVFAFLPWLVYILASGGNHWGVATAGGMIVSEPAIKLPVMLPLGTRAVMRLE